MKAEVAEILGIHAGDGSLYRTNWSLVWEVRGALDEKDYYINHICPLVEKAMKIKLTSKFRSDGKEGVWGIQTSKKEATSFLLKHGFKPGTKTYTVCIPETVKQGSKSVQRAFIRGVFDTDGCLNFSRINKRKEKDYPRIKISIASKALRDDLKELLDRLNFRSYTWDEKRYFSIALSGRENLKKWMKEIEPKNPKHLKKYEAWEKRYSAAIA